MKKTNLSLSILFMSMLSLTAHAQEVVEDPVCEDVPTELTYQFDDIDSCGYEGLIVSKKGDKWGYVDEKGKMVIPFAFEKAWGFRGGKAFVYRNEKFGMIDKEGKFVTPLIYDDVSDADEGMILVSKKDKKGYIDFSGKQIIPFDYTMAGNFRDGLAVVAISVGKDDRDEDIHKYGFIDKSNQVIIPFSYDELYQFNDGLALMSIQKHGKNRYGYINKQNKIIVQPQYDDAFAFLDDLAPVMKNDKWGFINTKGKEVIPLTYEYVWHFYKNGVAIAKKNGKQGVINRQNKVVIPFEYDDIEINSADLFFVQKDDESYFINSKNQRIDDEKMLTD